MEDSNNSLPPQQTVTAPQQSRPSSNKRRILYALLLFLVAAACFAGAFLWQQSEKDIVEANLRAANSQIEELKLSQSIEKVPTSEGAVPEVAKDETPDLIPGNVDTSRTDGRVMVEVPFSEAIEPTALWVEYGLSPTSLNTSTTKYTSGLGMGEPENGYVNGYAVFINTSDLKPGTIYYYRSAATTKNNQVVTSAVASFLTVK